MNCVDLSWLHVPTLCQVDLQELLTIAMPGANKKEVQQMVKFLHHVDTQTVPT